MCQRQPLGRDLLEKRSLDWSTPAPVGRSTEVSDCSANIAERTYEHAVNQVDGDNLGPVHVVDREIANESPVSPVCECVARSEFRSCKGKTTSLQTGVSP